MKIGVIGTKRMPDIMGKIFEERPPDLQLVYRCSEFYQEAAELADELQRVHEVDAILFSGATSYNYARRRVASTIPWAYLPHSRVAAFQACLEGIANFHNDLRSISVDCFPPDLLLEALEDVGIQGTEILKAPFDPEKEGFESKLLQFHRECFRQGRVSICFTSMEHIAVPLKNEGIPCVRIYPVKEAILEQIYHLQILDFSAKKHYGMLAIIAFQLDTFPCYDEKDLMFGEWERVRFQNQFKEKIYGIAQRMEAAVFSEETNRFYIVTSRNTLTNVFLKNYENWNLTRFGQQGAGNQIQIGIGIGSSMLETKTRALMALNRTVTERQGKSYMMEDTYQAIELPDSEERQQNGHSLTHFANRLHINTATLNKLCQVLKDHENMLTSYELAGYMSTSVRNANRILSRLEEDGWATVVGKRYAKKGRPARLMKIDLPDSLYLATTQTDTPVPVLSGYGEASAAAPLTSLRDS